MTINLGVQSALIKLPQSPPVATMAELTILREQLQNAHLAIHVMVAQLISALDQLTSARMSLRQTQTDLKIAETHMSIMDGDIREKHKQLENALKQLKIDGIGNKRVSKDYQLQRDIEQMQRHKEQIFYSVVASEDRQHPMRHQSSIMNSI